MQPPLSVVTSCHTFQRLCHANSRSRSFEIRPGFIASSLFGGVRWVSEAGLACWRDTWSTHRRSRVSCFLDERAAVILVVF